MAEPEKSPSYQWFPRDAAADERVMLMSWEQYGIYRFLLDHQSLHGSIPSDPNQLAAMLARGMTAGRLRRLWAEISACFVDDDQPGRLFNRKLRRVLREREEFRAKKSEDGKKGAAAKHGHGSAGGSATGTATSSASGSATQSASGKGLAKTCLPVPVPVPDPLNEESTGVLSSTAARALPEEPDLLAYQDAMRRHYPKNRNADSPTVSRALFEMASCLPPIAEFEASLAAWAASDSWRDEGGRYVPNPDKFVKEERWKATPMPRGKKSGAAISVETDETTLSEYEAIR